MFFVPVQKLSTTSSLAVQKSKASGSADGFYEFTEPSLAVQKSKASSS